MRNLYTIKSFIAISAIMASVALIVSCHQKPISTYSPVVNPEWSKGANIYEVNLRQYTPEGTFNAFRLHLPRLKEMGVDILWLMPIHPIGELNRKGALGSYYSVRDYKAVNPEFGTMDDFKKLVAEAHDLGMYVILDWVANHTSWDNALVTKYREWYTQNQKGELVSPYDWSDVVQLNYNNRELWDYMIDALEFWVEETNIDGYRCDVAFLVPTEFWNCARQELEEIKPVFMLAEAEEPVHHEHAFDMSYAWNMHNAMDAVGAGLKSASHLDSVLNEDLRKFPASAYRMQFTSNHDENSWKSTEYSRLGEGVKTFAVLKSTIPGMPLIYSGQEAGLNRMLKFFEKDEIVWSQLPLANFYKELLTLKKQNPALWNGQYGGTYTRISTSDDKRIFAFVRQKDSHQVFVILNLSPDPVSTQLTGTGYEGAYDALFGLSGNNFEPNVQLHLKGWEYRVYYR